MKTTTLPKKEFEKIKNKEIKSILVPNVTHETELRMRNKEIKEEVVENILIMYIHMNEKIMN